MTIPANNVKSLLLKSLSPALRDKLKGPSPKEQFDRILEGVSYDIKSRSHALVKELALLRRSSDNRREFGKVFVKGAPLIQKLLKEGKRFERILVPAENKFWASWSDQLENGLKIPRDILTYLCYERQFHKRSDDDKDLVVGSIAMPHSTDFAQVQTDSSFQKFLVLDSVQDPTNVGHLVSVASGLNWDGILPVGETCDPFEFKAVEASEGDVFDARILKRIRSSEQVLQLANELKLLPIVAHIEGVRIDSFVADVMTEKGPKPTLKYKGILLFLGNEGRGPSKSVIDCATRVTIPMAAKVESLNVAVSGAILMNQLGKLFSKLY